MNSLDRWRSKTKKQNKQAFQMQVIEKDYKYSEQHSRQTPESASDLDTTFGNNNMFYEIFNLMHIAALVRRVLNIFTTKTKYDGGSKALFSSSLNKFELGAAKKMTLDLEV